MQLYLFKPEAAKSVITFSWWRFTWDKKKQRASWWWRSKRELGSRECFLWLLGTFCVTLALYIRQCTSRALFILHLSTFQNVCCWGFIYISGTCSQSPPFKKDLDAEWAISLASASPPFKATQCQQKKDESPFQAEVLSSCGYLRKFSGALWNLLRQEKDVHCLKTLFSLEMGAAWEWG